MSVVPFPSKGSGPYIEGPVHCIGCKHKWIAVAPVGEFEDFECPQCGAFKGVRTSTITTEDQTVWRCNCGNDYFLLTMTGGAPLCANCGLRATSWADG